MEDTNKLTNIEERLGNIEKTLSELKELLKPVEKSCIKMQSHISFVEQTYDSIKYKLGYFINIEEPNINVKPDVPKINNV